MLIVALVVLAVVIAAGAAALWARPAQVTRASCDRIRVGMSRAEVESLLGGPPGDYRTGPTKMGPESEESLPMAVPSEPLPSEPSSPTPPPTINWALIKPHASCTWQGDTGFIDVTFSPEGVVRIKSFWPAIKLEQGPLDNVLWRAKRQWHRWFP
jgi:hypothetical protein